METLGTILGDNGPYFGPILILAAAFASFLFVRFILLASIYRGLERTHTEWDDIIAAHGVFRQIAYLAPAVVLYVGAINAPVYGELARKVISIYIAANAVIIVDRSLSAALQIYNLYPVSQKRPIKAYIQIAKLFVYLIGGIAIVAFLLGQSPWGIIGGLGAITAVLILVFRNTILSLIASIQLFANDLIHIGDWIEVPDSGADGAITDVSLHTVKVENFDKTIVAVPTYRLVEGSFRNWRGMREAGGRRIKRSLLIDQTSVKFCDEEMLGNLKSIDLLKIYLAEKYLELERAGVGDDELNNTPAILNRRVLTNLGTFRAYALEYLRNHPKINQDLKLLVRQRQPTSDGLPLEIYAFSRETDLEAYELIQSDIFDHLIAVVSFFDLRLFQHPTGSDMQRFFR